MNNSLDRLIDGMIATLRQSVIPNLSGDFARGQAFGVIYMLNSVRLRASWSNAFLSEQLLSLDQVASDLAQIKADLPGAPLPVCRGVRDLPTAAALEAERDAGDGKICELIDWLRDKRGALAPDAVARAQDAIDRYIQRQLKWELSTSAKPMFEEISRGSD